MSRFHLDSIFQVHKCENRSCSIPLRHHYDSLEEAQSVREISLEWSSISSNKREMNFRREFNERTNDHYLEASMLTPLEEEVIFTVENCEQGYRGTMFFAGREIVLASRGSLEETAHATAIEAQKLYGDDLWPDVFVVELYLKLLPFSTLSQVKSDGLFYLDLISDPSALQQTYEGETPSGALISVQAGHSYAIATVTRNGVTLVVNETSLIHQKFHSVTELASFVAKSFGPLLEMKEI